MTYTYDYYLDLKRQRDANQEKWDRRFLELAKIVSTWSKDPSTQVGSVLVDNRKNVVGLGYNGFPRGVRDLEERYNNRELKYQMVVHAEENALIAAGNRSRGSTLYVYPSFMLPPICSRCCSSAIQAGISTIVGYLSDVEPERAARWKDSILISKSMCDEAGVKYRGIKEN